jgi:hypothetical protein
MMPCVSFSLSLSLSPPPLPPLSPSLCGAATDGDIAVGDYCGSIHRVAQGTHLFLFFILFSFFPLFSCLIAGAFVVSLKAHIFKSTLYSAFKSTLYSALVW